MMKREFNNVPNIINIFCKDAFSLVGYVDQYFSTMCSVNFVIWILDAILKCEDIVVM